MILISKEIKVSDLKLLSLYNNEGKVATKDDKSLRIIKKQKENMQVLTFFSR